MHVRTHTHAHTRCVVGVCNNEIIITIQYIPHYHNLIILYKHIVTIISRIVILISDIMEASRHFLLSWITKTFANTNSNMHMHGRTTHILQGTVHLPGMTIYGDAKNV